MCLTRLEAPADTARTLREAERLYVCHDQTETRAPRILGYISAGRSLDEQRRLLKRSIQRIYPQAEAIFAVDPTATAEASCRPGFEAATRAVAQHAIDVIVVTDLARIVASLADLVVLMEWLDRYRVLLWALDEVDRLAHELGLDCNQLAKRAIARHGRIPCTVDQLSVTPAGVSRAGTVLHLHHGTKTQPR